MRAECCVEGCTRPVAAHKLCSKHYYRQQRGGNPHEKSRFEKTPTERFLERVIKLESGCWEWGGHRDRKGYGRFFAGGFNRAHRFAYHTFVGPIPPGMYVCHKCDNPACANPEHLFVGTAQDNNVDMAQKGRHGRGGGMRKLPESDVLAIYRLKGNASPKELGKQYGVDRNTIYAIWNHKIWRKITLGGS